MAEIQVTDETFVKEVVQRTEPVLQVSTPTSGSCRMLSPIIGESYEGCAGKARVATIDADRQGAPVSRYGG